MSQSVHVDERGELWDGTGVKDELRIKNLFDDELYNSKIYF